ncbi:hypothetical protein Nmel_004508 [Mimus melanotis]
MQQAVKKQLLHSQQERSNGVKSHVPKKTEEPCSLTVQVKQILQTCRLFSGMYFYERRSSQAAGNLSKRSGGTMSTPSSSTVKVHKTLRMLSAVNRLSAVEYRA